MTELSKVVSSIILLGVGFFAASLFGPPDLAERLAQRLRPAAGESTSWLEPLAPSGPPLQDPTQSAAPLSPLPLASTPPALAATPAPAAATPSVTAFAPEVGVQGVAPTAGGANDWYNASAGWGEPTLGSTGLSLPPAPALPNADWPDASARLAAPIAMPPSSTPSEARAFPPASPVASAAPAASSWGQTNWDAPVGGQPFASQPAAQQAIGTDWGQPAAAQTQFAQPDYAQPGFAQPDYGPAYLAGKPSIGAPVREPAPIRMGTHVVADGDTLPLLAERYLGEASRAQELFRLNDDRLDSPDLLPIGVVLRVPDEPRSVRPSPLAAPSVNNLAAPNLGSDPWSNGPGFAPANPAYNPSPAFQAPQRPSGRVSAIGFADGPALPGLPAATPPATPATMEHQPSRMVPIGDPLEPTAPLPALGFGAGEGPLPRAMSDLSW
ncbi:LysM peptidoglycan-binding domain-containing protein [Botrimarina hoheduenensis]|uniref:LysM peptidoglycan-binding domain-containing protein n=1 Tax=Botrimarina hoheduenensis TaxID=2528000 RepID=UPI0011B72DFE|nr:LysM domain-containing protein [Botrimarina hoheduenensis]